MTLVAVLLNVTNPNFPREINRVRFEIPAAEVMSLIEDVFINSTYTAESLEFELNQNYSELADHPLTEAVIEEFSLNDGLKIKVVWEGQ